MGVFRYKFLLLYVVIILIVCIVTGGAGDSDALDRENENFQASERRVMETFNDEDWHVAHLKETDFQEEDPVRTRRLDSACLPETFADKIKRYRRTLQNDAALIEFVSAQAIPVDESELLQTQCNISNRTNNQNTTHDSTTTIDTSVPIKSSTDESEITAIFPIMKYTGGNVQLEDFEMKTKSVAPVTKKVPITVAFKAPQLKVDSKMEITNDTKVNNFTKDSVNQTSLNTTIVPIPIGTNPIAETKSNDTAAKKESPAVSKNKKTTKTLNKGPEVLHQATTPKVKHKKEKEKHESRRGEYVFSSHEYYDDVVDFDLSVCPDAVEEIILELDVLRPYDVECELALEWSSLE